jgi:hypothetical protein
MIRQRAKYVGSAKITKLGHPHASTSSWFCFIDCRRDHSRAAKSFDNHTKQLHTPQESTAST